MCNIQTALSTHPLKIGHVYMDLCVTFKQLYLRTHWKLDMCIWTYLLGIVHTTTS